LTLLKWLGQSRPFFSLAFRLTQSRRKTSELLARKRNAPENDTAVGNLFPRSAARRPRALRQKRHTCENYVAAILQRILRPVMNVKIQSALN
jgi:hypothetical protein